MSLFKWDTRINAEFRGLSPLDVFKTFIFEGALQTNDTVYSDTVQGYIKSQEVTEYLEACEGVRLLFTSNDPDSGRLDFYMVNESRGFIQVLYSDTHLEFIMFSLDKKRVNEMCGVIRGKLSDAPVSGTVHMLAFEQNYYLVELGEVNAPLERGNYPDPILKQYDRVIEDLQSTLPSGRLTLLNGEPGTGKSFLVRGIVSAVRGLYIYVPASVSGTITGPDIIPLIMREKDKNIPIILLMEDADSSLATRQLDNITHLSDLLNMSDGILGDMADLRIIATTNTRKEDIDGAVLREGRCNEYMQLGPLTVSHAHDIFERLLGENHSNPNAFIHKTVLAEIYKEARNFGWKPQTPARKQKRRYRDLLDYPISPY